MVLKLCPFHSYSKYLILEAQTSVSLLNCRGPFGWWHQWELWSVNEVLCWQGSEMFWCFEGQSRCLGHFHHQASPGTKYVHIHTWRCNYLSRTNPSVIIFIQCSMINGTFILIYSDIRASWEAGWSRSNFTNLQNTKWRQPKCPQVLVWLCCSTSVATVS